MFARQIVRRMSSSVCKEVSVPVPWGVIAAKQWTNVNQVETQQGKKIILLNMTCVL